MTLPDDVNIDCKYQSQRRGTLICKLANLSFSSHATKEVDPEICHECPVGRINRELGCDKISGKVKIFHHQWDHGEEKHLFGNIILWCKLRKREITHDKCLTCPSIGTQFTSPILKKTLEYFEKLGFNSAKENLEKAREHLLNGNLEGSITNSISAVESTFKSILDILKEPHPTETVTSLWKFVSNKLNLRDGESTSHLKKLVGSLSGCINAIGGLRNDLSDAHGKSLVSPSVFDSYAELELNLAATICLFTIRKYQEFITKEKK